jgi:hypothetical protein
MRTSDSVYLYCVILPSINSYFVSSDNVCVCSHGMGGLGVGTRIIRNPGKNYSPTFLLLHIVAYLPKARTVDYELCVIVANKSNIQFKTSSRVTQTRDNIEYLIAHGLRNKYRVQQLFCCMCMCLPNRCLATAVFHNFIIHLSGVGGHTGWKVIS